MKKISLFFLIVFLLQAGTLFAENFEISATFFDSEDKKIGVMKALPEDFSIDQRGIIFIPIPENATRVRLNIDGYNELVLLEKLKEKSKYIELPSFIGFVYFCEDNILAITP